MPDRSAGQNTAAQAAAPKGLHIRDSVARRVLRDRNLDEPCPTQQPQKLLGIGETVRVVSLR